MDLVLMKLPNGMLAPYGDESVEQLKKVKNGALLNAKTTRMRNYENHKRFFAFVDLSFGIWAETVPKMEYKGQEVLPNKTRFWKDMVILAGHYTSTVNLRGEVRLEAKSISFSSMDEDEFQQLFSDCINVVLTKILTHGQLTEQKIREHVERIMAFD